MQSRNYLAHYGILGMQWGRRRSPEQLRQIGERKISRINQQKSKLASTHASRIKELDLRKEANEDLIKEGEAAKKDGLHGKQSVAADRLNTQYEKKQLQSKIDQDGFWTKGGARRAQESVADMDKHLTELDEKDAEYNRVIANAIDYINSRNMRISAIDAATKTMGKKFILESAAMDKKIGKISKKYIPG